MPLSIDRSKSLSFALSDLDVETSPADDFFQYAVGGWLKANPIPADHSRWGSFEMLNAANQLTIKDILEHSEQFQATDDAELARKVALFYAAGMDEAAIERAGAAPLRKYFEKIDAIASVDEALAVAGELHRTIAAPFFHLLATPDAKQSDQVIAGLVQGGLGLPERDYYLATDERSTKIRQDYLDHMTRMFVLSGLTEAAAGEAAAAVVAFETKLATASTTKEDLRDPVKNYHKMTFAEVQSRYPAIPWTRYFVELGLPEPGAIDVGQLEFFAGFNTLCTEPDFSAWKMYLRWNVLRNLARYLSAAFVDEQFRFYGQVLNGQKEQKPRWKRIVDMADDCLGKAVGKLYVRENFSPIAKARAEQLVVNLIAAMEKRIMQLPWMSEATKAEALKKLHGIMVKIGYPTVWTDYSSLVLPPDSFVDMVIACAEFETRRELAKIGKPVDRTEWLMHPQTVNAYYEPSKNEIVFPAGILQAPFFDDAADDAMNYGGIGAVIGHEITHGFDDQGRQYDAAGNLRDWWTKEDEQRFTERAKRLVEQFNTYSPLEGVFVNGQFTLGENIADLGGLQVALDAFMMTGQAKSGELIDGFTPLQRFFLSYAETWKSAIRDEKARLYIMVDPHAPAKFRANGPLSNMQSFFEAFQVAPTAGMYRAPDERVVIW